MAKVTGPISTLPGANHPFPDGLKCDLHPNKLAVARSQGETDSLGCEMHDMCRECFREYQDYMKSPNRESLKGRCDWCGHDATDLRDARDYDEGLCGRVYRVCGACKKRQHDRLLSEMDA